MQAQDAGAGTTPPIHTLYSHPIFTPSHLSPTCCWLVQEDEWRPLQQPRSHGQALALPARQAAHRQPAREATAHLGGRGGGIGSIDLARCLRFRPSGLQPGGGQHTGHPPPVLPHTYSHIYTPLCRLPTTVLTCACSPTAASTRATRLRRCAFGIPAGSARLDQ